MTYKKWGCVALMALITIIGVGTKSYDTLALGWVGFVMGYVAAKLFT